jgi:hypothetical protein
VWQAARQRLGKKVARQLFLNQRQVAVRDSDGICRKVFKQGLRRGMAWRVKDVAPPTAGEMPAEGCGDGATEPP